MKRTIFDVLNVSYITKLFYIITHVEPKQQFNWQAHNSRPVNSRPLQNSFSLWRNVSEEELQNIGASFLICESTRTDEERTIDVTDAYTSMCPISKPPSSPSNESDKMYQKKFTVQYRASFVKNESQVPFDKNDKGLLKKALYKFS